jgi:sucrose phosphorylase
VSTSTFQNQKQVVKPNLQAKKSTPEQVRIVTYPHTIGTGFQDLIQANNLIHQLTGLAPDYHILPFYTEAEQFPDGGFAVKDYTVVNPKYGSWADVQQLAKVCNVWSDIIPNHIAIDSPEFVDVLANGPDSKFWNLFIRFTDIYPHGMMPWHLHGAKGLTEKMPFKVIPTNINGVIKQVVYCNTFMPSQIDTNGETVEFDAYFDKALGFLASQGIAGVRIDAPHHLGKPDTIHTDSKDENHPSYKFVNIPRAKKIWDKLIQTKIETRGMGVLLEYFDSFDNRSKNEMAEGKQTYTFELQCLGFHTVFEQDTTAIVEFFNHIAPFKDYNVIAPTNHDGLVVLGIGSNLTKQQEQKVIQKIKQELSPIAKKASGPEGNNVDENAVINTLWDACGGDLGWKVFQKCMIFAPGIASPYLPDLLKQKVVENAHLFEETKEGRFLARGRFSVLELESRINEDADIQEVFELLALRNSHPACLGNFECLQLDTHTLTQAWKNGNHYLKFTLDTKTGESVVGFSEY